VLVGQLRADFLLQSFGKRCDDAGKFLQSLPVRETLNGSISKRLRHCESLFFFSIAGGDARGLAFAAFGVQLQPVVQRGG